MKTVVINTSKEAKNTKLDVLFKAPFDQNSLLWIESGLSDLGEKAYVVKQSLIAESDTIDKDYQLIVLVDLYPFPLGNDKKAVEIYRMLMEKYIRATLIETLYKTFNLAPKGAALYFIDSAKEIRGLEINKMANNPVEQEEEEKYAYADQEARLAKAASYADGDLSDDEIIPVPKRRVRRSEEQRILMEIFGWTEDMNRETLGWNMRVSADEEESVDFSGVFAETSSSVAKSHETAAVLEIAFEGVLAPQEGSRLFSTGRFPVYTIVCPVVRDNEQSKIEGFFGVFANIFTRVQEKTLIPQAEEFTKEEIKTLLSDALKKYRYFSLEENIQVRYEPIASVFKKCDTICNKRKNEARSQNEDKGKSDDEVVEDIIAMHRPVPTAGTNWHLRGTDKAFHELMEDIFASYDAEVIQKQNNEVVRKCLAGLWSWRDKQTSETFKEMVSATVSDPTVTADGNQGKTRDNITFIEEEYEAKRSELINKVTKAEHELASNKNVLLKVKDLVLQYGDWMRKGKWYWVSVIGAIFTVLATTFPFFYTEVSAGSTGMGFQVNLLLIVGFCAFLYAVSASVYITYINRKKLELLGKLEDLRKESVEERKASIKALYRYYNDTVVEAETLYLLWREIQRRDRENAKKGIKRNHHIKRLKSLIEQIERFITMMKLDVDKAAKAGQKEIDQYTKLGLRLNGEESFYEEGNRRVYCILPEQNGNQPKGGTDEA